MKGWIVNLHRPEETREVERDQTAVFYLDSEPVFEVWFWHAARRRWWVMSWSSDDSLVSQGVVYFTPSEVPTGLRARLS